MPPIPKVIKRRKQRDGEDQEPIPPSSPRPSLEEIRARELKEKERLAQEIKEGKLPSSMVLEGWTEETVKIQQWNPQTKKPDKGKEIKAWVWGTIAVYPGFETKDIGKWVLGHTLSGLKILVLSKQPDAIRVSQDLYEYGDYALSFSLDYVINAHFPKRLLTWLKQCRKEDRYIPYNRGY